MKEMWDVVKTDATSKSTLYILDTEDQLSSMKLEDNENPATHPFQAKATLPAYAPTTREPDENGFRNIQNMPE